MNPLIHLLLALVIAVGFCLLLAAGSFVTMLLVMYLHGEREPWRDLGLKRESKPASYEEIQPTLWYLVVIFLLSFGILYLPPADLLYAAMGAAMILLGVFIGVGIYIDSQLRNQTP